MKECSIMESSGRHCLKTEVRVSGISYCLEEKYSKCPPTVVTWRTLGEVHFIGVKPDWSGQKHKRWGSWGSKGEQLNTFMKFGRSKDLARVGHGAKGGIFFKCEVVEMTGWGWKRSWSWRRWCHQVCGRQGGWNQKTGHGGLTSSRVPLPLIGGKAGYLLSTCCWQTTRNTVPILEKLQSSWRGKTLQQNRITPSVISLQAMSAVAFQRRSRKFSWEVAFDLELESRVGFS